MIRDMAMMTTRTIWPRVWRAALIGLAVVAGCLDDPRDDTRATATMVDEVSSPAVLADEAIRPSDVVVCGPVCGVCGNGICEVGELRFCPMDCPLSRCGNGICDGNETLLSCPRDCGLVITVCGDGVCSPSETHQSCPADCP